jgi:four helix bundle protein
MNRKEYARGSKQYNGYRDLKVYQRAYKLAIDIFHETKAFPKEEKFSLTDQIRRSSRSIPANIAEAWKKRSYSKMFVSKLIDCAGEAGETEVWLDFAKDANYLSADKHAYFISNYDEISRMLYSLINKPEKFCIQNKSSRK